MTLIPAVALMLTMGILVMKKLVIGIKEAHLKGDPNKKMTHTEVFQKMGMLICATHPLRIIKDTLTALHMEIVVLEVLMVPRGSKGYYPNPQLM